MPILRRGSRYRTMSLMRRLSNVRGPDTQVRIFAAVWPAKPASKKATIGAERLRWNAPDILTWRPQPALLPQKFRSRFAALRIILSQLPRRRAAGAFIRTTLAAAQCGDRASQRTILRPSRHSVDEKIYRTPVS